MSELDRIYQKYIGVFYEIDGGGSWIDLSAVRYALRAALREMAARQAIELAVAIDERDVADAACRKLEVQVCDLRMTVSQLHEHIRANQPLITELDALRQQIAQMDADNARLTQELRTVRSWSVAPTGNGYPTAILTAAEASAQTAPGKTRTVAEMLDAIAPEDNASWNDAMLSMLDAETADYWHGIAAGRWTWRKLPKSTRLAMVRHVLSFGPEERAMSMSEFDAIKPHWMPGAGSHPITFGVPWSTLSDMRTEIEVTP